ncbi:10561_t:CDS:2, partial [Scutellospora calospora]
MALANGLFVLKIRDKIEQELKGQDTGNFENRDFRPDVGVWFQRPTFPQRRMPIIYTCPHPNVWIE